MVGDSSACTKEYYWTFTIAAGQSFVGPTWVQANVGMHLSSAILSILLTPNPTHLREVVNRKSYLCSIEFDEADESV